VGLRSLACWDCGFESRPGLWVSVVSVVCCQVEISTTGRSLVQRSPTECGVSECDIKTSRTRGPRPIRAGEPSKTLQLKIRSLLPLSMTASFHKTTVSRVAAVPRRCTHTHARKEFKSLCNQDSRVIWTILGQLWPSIYHWDYYESKLLLLLLCICVGFVSYLCSCAGFIIGPWAVELQGRRERVRASVKKILRAPQQGRTGKWKKSKETKQWTS
jgi:hypothetical protein